MKKIGIACLLLVFLLTGCAGSEIRARFKEASELLEEGEYEDAQEIFEEIIEEERFLAEAYRGAGLCQLFEGDSADACISLEKSLLHADNAGAEFVRDVNLYLAFARTRNGQYEKAMQIYSDLTARGAEADVLFLRGRLHLVMDEEEEAKADFDRASEIASDYDLFVNIYRVYESTGRSADGARYLEKALELANLEEQNYYDRALVNYYLQNYQDAKELLIAGIRADSQDTRCIFLLGRLYLAMDDVPDARAVYREHLSDEEVAPFAYNGLALCDMEEQDYKSALKNIREGLDYENEDADQGLLYNEIVACEHLKDWSKARDLAARYVARYPADEQGLKEYEFLSTR